MIKDLAELDKLLKLCRKRGVTELKIGEVDLKLGPLPTKAQSDAESSDEIDTPHSLTPEQLVFFSAGGEPPG